MLQNNPHADAWRQTHLGQLLGHALRQFDQRVRTLMVQDAAQQLAQMGLSPSICVRVILQHGQFS